MNKIFETSFIKETIENTPFSDLSAQNFFKEWCRINDSIIPEFISREEWEQVNLQSILKKNEQEKQILFLPTDLHLCEMMNIIKIIDHNTFVRNTEFCDKKANQIRELGVIFEKAGLYIQEYLLVLDENNEKQIAIDIAREFYQYGLSLQNKKQSDSIPSKKILSPEEKTQLDEWLLGENVFQKRILRFGDNPTEEQREQVRKNLYSVYFKTLSKKGFETNEDKPWKKTIIGPIKQIQDKTRKNIIKSIKIPEKELKGTLFRRGVEKLLTNIKIEGKRFYDLLQVNQLKEELDQTRRSGDIHKISIKELEIAQKIQIEINKFKYEILSHNPSEMVETQIINCVGSTIIVGGILNELSIKNLNASVPSHAVIFLVTSDDKVYWQDFTPPPGNLSEKSKQIVDSDIDNNSSKKTNNVCVQDIVDLVKDPNNKQLNFLMKGFLNNKRLNVSLSDTAEFQVLSNIGFEFKIKGNDNSLRMMSASDELSLALLKINAIDNYMIAIEFFNTAINVNPINSTATYGLGTTLSQLGEILDDKKEKEKLFRKSIEILDEAVELVDDSEYRVAKNNAVNNLIRLQDEK